MVLSVNNSVQSGVLTVTFWQILLGFGIIFIDQLSKALTFYFLPVIHSQSYVYPYGGVGLFKNFLGIEFSLNHMTNFGAAWGAFGDYQLALLVFRIALIAFLIIYLFRLNKEKSWQLPLILIISGAIGNVSDYFIYGYVIDMFHFIFWGFDYPVFNIADAAICIGIGWLCFLSLFKKAPLTK